MDFYLELHQVWHVDGDTPSHVVVDQQTRHLAQVVEPLEAGAHVSPVDDLVVVRNVDGALLQSEVLQMGTEVQYRHQRDRSSLARPHQPELHQVAEVLHELGEVLQGQAVAVDGVGGGEGDVQPGEPPGQQGPALVGPEHHAEPVRLEPVPVREAQLLLPVQAEPLEVRGGLQDVERFERSVHHSNLRPAGHQSLPPRPADGELEDAVGEDFVPGRVGRLQPHQSPVLVQQTELSQ